MKSINKQKVYQLLKKGMRINDVLEFLEISKYQHHKEFKHDIDYREKIISIRSSLRRIPSTKMEKFLDVYKKTQNIEKTLGKTSVSITQYKNERKLNHSFYKDIFKTPRV